MKVGHKHMQGGNVPGGHFLPFDGVRKPFITPMAECNSIPLRHSDVVADVGAYVGTYAIRCARFPVKQVIAYEPTPQTFSILSMTRLPNLRLVNAAVVADERPSVKLHISKGIGVTNSIILSNRKERSVEVQAVSYVRAVAGASIVKIDVEGAEYTYPIVQPGLRALIVDFHPIPGRDWKGRTMELVRGFKADGFEPVIEPDFSCGWTCAGSWVRPMATEGEFSPMMSGKVCCGCGRKIRGTRKSLCSDCYGRWLPRHRDGFACVSTVAASHSGSAASPAGHR